MPLQREKQDAFVGLYCKPSEKLKWLAAFPDGNLSRVIREFLNRAAQRKKKAA